MKTQRLVEYDNYFCDVCRTYIYDELLGEPTMGIAPRTLVDMLPTSWRCPICGADKAQLRASTMLDGFFFDEPCGKHVRHESDVTVKPSADFPIKR